MVRSFRSVVGAALLSLGLAASAHASTTTQLGDISAKGTAYYGDPSVSGSFSDYYNFSLTGSTPYSVTMSGSGIQNAVFTLYSGTYSGSASGSEIGSPVPQSISFGNYFFTGTSGNLTAGNYYFDVSGTGASNGVYAGTIAVSAVPLPPALPMFGAALLALLGLGFVRKRGSDMPSVA